MNNLSPLQQKVFDAVIAWGQSKSWFRGVCMDNFPDDVEIQADFDEAVSAVCFETAMWDDRGFFDFAKD
jgi:hypothetical protein